MSLTISLAKKVLIFYSFLTPVLIVASLYNLIYGLILGQASFVRIGPFSLFGFILLPLLLRNTYRQNKCIIQLDKVSIGKADFLASNYNFSINEKFIPLRDRPIISPLKKTYPVFVITKKGTNNVVFEKDMDVFKSDIKKMKSALLNNYKEDQVN